MNIGNTKTTLASITNDITPQKQLQEKEKKLQNFVKRIPITIEYGCHTIELKADKHHYNGYTFRVVENDGKGVKIRIT